MTTYAAVLANISTSLAFVKTTKTLAKTAVKIAVAPSRHPVLPKAFKTTMHTMGRSDAIIVTASRVFLISVVSS